MKKNVILIVFYLLFAFYNGFMLAQSGYANKKDIEEIKNRTLVVCVETGDEKAMEKLANSPNTLKEYKDKLDYFNESMKKIITKNWKLHTKIEYKNFDEVREIEKSNNKDYVVLMFNKVNVGNGLTAKFSSGGNYAVNRYDPLISTKGNRWVDLFTITKRNLDVGTLQLRLPERGGTIPSVYVNLSSTDPLEEDIYYAIYQLQKYVEIVPQTNALNRDYWVKSTRENSHKLKDKKLYILEPFLNKSLTIGMFKDLYPHEIVVADEETYRNVIVNNVPDAAYVMIVPMIDQTALIYTTKDTKDNSVKICWTHYIVDASNGEIIAYSDWYDSNPFSLIEEDYNLTIKKDNLKHYLKKR
ncbi:MAG: hypothetical protein HYU67_07470 [Flavobacteriia bacterium]|nr:hypothetical protein [Flavobacteriia bacterium]